jgi:hypothetical protein
MSDYEDYDLDVVESRLRELLNDVPAPSSSPLSAQDAAEIQRAVQAAWPEGHPPTPAELAVLDPDWDDSLFHDLYSHAVAADEPHTDLYSLDVAVDEPHTDPDPLPEPQPGPWHAPDPEPYGGSGHPPGWSDGLGHDDGGPGPYGDANF